MIASQRAGQHDYILRRARAFHFEGCTHSPFIALLNKRRTSGEFGQSSYVPFTFSSLAVAISFQFNPNPGTFLLTGPRTGEPVNNPMTVDAISSPSPASGVVPIRWRQLLAMLSIAAIVVGLRGYSISVQHSEGFDDEYHLVRGVAFLERGIGERSLNDPPLGEGLSALPLWLTGSVPSDPAIDAGIYGHRLSPQTLLNLLAIWKSLLFLPLLAIVARWVSELYGVRSAWIASALLVFDPTFAAHIPLSALDVLAVEGIIAACYVATRYICRPTLTRLGGMCACVATAMMLKHTAVILPGVIGLMAISWWWVVPRFGSVREAPPLRQQVGHIALACVFVPFFIWASTLFDISKPLPAISPMKGSDSRIIKLLDRNWPGGTYIRSFASGARHGHEGSIGYLLGERRTKGWWYYYPVVATYKLTLATLALIVMCVTSFAVVRVRAAEWLLLVPLISYLAFSLTSSINIGFRHFLPALGLLLMLIARVTASRELWRGASYRPWFAWCATGLVILGAIETTWMHPDYLSFTNAARRSHQPYLAISDSNVDWAQSLLQLRAWEVTQPADRPIALASFFPPERRRIEYYMNGSRIETVMIFPYDSLPPKKKLPVNGIFVVSPVCLAGTYDSLDRLRPLRSVTPRETIGDCLLVYDLDAIPGKIHWPIEPAAHPTNQIR